jgi:hypothetical protein
MRRVLVLASAIVASAMVIGTQAGAQQHAVGVGQSASNAGALAISGGTSITSHGAEIPHNTPSLALGSFGQGANPCAEGMGFNFGASGFGVGANHASTNPACLRLLAARAALAAAESRSPQHGHAATLIACMQDQHTMIACQASGLWHSYASHQVAYAQPQPVQQPQVSHAAYYGATGGHAAQSAHYSYTQQTYAAVAPQAMQPVLIPAYVPGHTVVVPGWCSALSGFERQKYYRDCGGR